MNLLEEPRELRFGRPTFVVAASSVSEDVHYMDLQASSSSPFDRTISGRRRFNVPKRKTDSAVDWLHTEIIAGFEVDESAATLMPDTESPDIVLLVSHAGRPMSVGDLTNLLEAVSRPASRKNVAISFDPDENPLS